MLWQRCVLVSQLEYLFLLRRIQRPRLLEQYELQVGIVISVATNLKLLHARASIFLHWQLLELVLVVGLTLQ